MSTDQPTKKLSLAFGPKKSDTAKKLHPPKPLNGIKRPHASLRDSDDEDDTSGNHTAISHFDQAAGGAIHKDALKTTDKKLVIPTKPNHDRIDYKRRGQHSALPTQENGDSDISSTTRLVTYGLTVPKKDSSVDGHDSIDRSNDDHTTSQPAKTEDEMALDALMGKVSSNRTIPVITEDEAYHRDVDDAQDVPTLNEYLAIPVSEFGAACLRGMGWKDTETLGGSKSDQSMLKPRTLDRRPALLGVGAKPSSAVGVEIGEWGKAAKGKTGEGYNPVVLKNKMTGEILTEQELTGKVDNQKRGKGGMIFDKSGIGEDRRRKTYESDKDTDRSRNRDRIKDHNRDKDQRLLRDNDNRDYRDSERDEKYRSERQDRRRSSSRDRYHRKDDKYRESKRRRTRSRSASRDKYRSSKYDNRRSRDGRDGQESRRDGDDNDKRRRDRYDKDYNSSSRRRHD
jgi:G-patch domain